MSVTCHLQVRLEAGEAGEAEQDGARSGGHETGIPTHGV